ncbi:unannotated protein [freshwater metagenome]|uniref:Unannotated protein n=1 Tax=freshwater metagenome TaxID=449393 RepID=A0A6J6RBY6_9ZZZZ
MEPVTPVTPIFVKLATPATGVIEVEPTSDPPVETDASMLPSAVVITLFVLSYTVISGCVVNAAPL